MNRAVDINSFFCKKQKKGFSLIEGLLVIMIVGIIASSFLSAFLEGNRLISESKKKVTATALANERMEMMRNLTYDQVGVIGGIPQGMFSESEFLEKSGVEYRIFTDIRYVDDAYDGKGDSTPKDLINTDYKIATITVSWGTEQETQRVRLSSFFVPPGLESTIGAGTLSLNIIDSSGAGIPSANVRIENNSENVAFSTLTDTQGNIFLPGAPESQQSYKIVVQKDAYESVSTYPPYPITAFTPIDEHASVLEGEVTSKAIIMDKLSDIHLIAKTAGGETVPERNMSLFGGRILGTDTTNEKDIYGYNEELSLGLDGEEIIEDMSPGEYTLEVLGDDSDRYVFLSVSPGIFGKKNAFYLNSGIHQTQELIFADTEETSFLISILDNQDNSFLGEATVQVRNADKTFEKEKLSDQYGNVFFSLDDGIVLGETYTITVSLEGYETFSKESTLDEDLVAEEILLEKN